MDEDDDDDDIQGAAGQMQDEDADIQGAAGQMQDEEDDEDMSVDTESWYDQFYSNAKTIIDRLAQKEYDYSKTQTFVNRIISRQMDTDQSDLPKTEDDIKQHISSLVENPYEERNQDELVKHLQNAVNHRMGHVIIGALVEYGPTGPFKRKSLLQSLKAETAVAVDSFLAQFGIISTDDRVQENDASANFLNSMKNQRNIDYRLGFSHTALVSLRDEKGDLVTDYKGKPLKQKRFYPNKRAGNPQYTGVDGDRLAGERNASLPPGRRKDHLTIDEASMVQMGIFDAMERWESEKIEDQDVCSVLLYYAQLVARDHIYPLFCSLSNFYDSTEALDGSILFEVLTNLGFQRMDALKSNVQNRGEDNDEWKRKLDMKQFVNFCKSEGFITVSVQNDIFADEYFDDAKGNKTLNYERSKDKCSAMQRLAEALTEIPSPESGPMFVPMCDLNYEYPYLVILRLAYDGMEQEYLQLYKSLNARPPTSRDPARDQKRFDLLDARLNAFKNDTLYDTMTQVAQECLEKEINTLETKIRDDPENLLYTDTLTALQQLRGKNLTEMMDHVRNQKKSMPEDQGKTIHKFVTGMMKVMTESRRYQIKDAQFRFFRGTKDTIQEFIYKWYTDGKEASELPGTYTTSSKQFDTFIRSHHYAYLNKPPSPRPWFSKPKTKTDQEQEAREKRDSNANKVLETYDLSQEDLDLQSKLIARLPNNSERADKVKYIKTQMKKIANSKDVSYYMREACEILSQHHHYSWHLCEYRTPMNALLNTVVDKRKEHQYMVPLLIGAGFELQKKGDSWLDANLRDINDIQAEVGRLMDRKIRMIKVDESQNSIDGGELQNLLNEQMVARYRFRVYSRQPPSKLVDNATQLHWPASTVNMLSGESYILKCRLFLEALINNSPENPGADQPAANEADTQLEDMWKTIPDYARYSPGFMIMILRATMWPNKKTEETYRKMLEDKRKLQGAERTLERLNELYRQSAYLRKLLLLPDPEEKGEEGAPRASGPVPGTELVPKSTVDDINIVKALDGKTIGTRQYDRKTVVDSEGKVVGKRTPDGAVVATPLSGVRMAKVVALESMLTEEGTVMVGGKLRSIGLLKPDRVKVVDSEGNVVALRNADGSVVVPGTEEERESRNSGPVPGTELVPQSTVDENNIVKEKKKDGKTIGTLQYDGETVVDSEGKVVGVLTVDGAVVATPLLVLQTTLESTRNGKGKIVKGLNGQTIGTLQYDNKTVVDIENKVVGVLTADGAVVATPLSGVLMKDVVSLNSIITENNTVMVGVNNLKSIGHLLPDKVTVIDDLGKVVALRNADGSVVAPDEARKDKEREPAFKGFARLGRVIRPRRIQTDDNQDLDTQEFINETIDQLLKDENGNQLTRDDLQEKIQTLRKQVDETWSKLLKNQTNNHTCELVGKYVRRILEATVDDGSDGSVLSILNSYALGGMTFSESPFLHIVPTSFPKDKDSPVLSRPNYMLTRKHLYGAPHNPVMACVLQDNACGMLQVILEKITLDKDNMIEWLISPNLKGVTALHAAIDLNKYDIVDLILDKVLKLFDGHEKVISAAIHAVPYKLMIRSQELPPGKRLYSTFNIAEDNPDGTPTNFVIRYYNEILANFKYDLKRLGTDVEMSDPQPQDSPRADDGEDQAETQELDDLPETPDKGDEYEEDDTVAVEAEEEDEAEGADEDEMQDVDRPTTSKKKTPKAYSREWTRSADIRFQSLFDVAIRRIFDVFVRHQIITRVDPLTINGNVDADAPGVYSLESSMFVDGTWTKHWVLDQDNNYENAQIQNAMQLLDEMLPKLFEAGLDATVGDYGHMFVDKLSSYQSAFLFHTSLGYLIQLSKLVQDISDRLRLYSDFEKHPLVKQEREVYHSVEKNITTEETKTTELYVLLTYTERKFENLFDMCFESIQTHNPMEPDKEQARRFLKRWQCGFLIAAVHSHSRVAIYYGSKHFSQFYTQQFNPKFYEDPMNNIKMQTSFFGSKLASGEDDPLADHSKTLSTMYTEFTEQTFIRRVDTAHEFSLVEQLQSRLQRAEAIAEKPRKDLEELDRKYAAGEIERRDYKAQKKEPEKNLQECEDFVRRLQMRIEMINSGCIGYYTPSRREVNWDSAEHGQKKRKWGDYVVYDFKKDTSQLHTFKNGNINKRTIMQEAVRVMSADLKFGGEFVEHMIHQYKQTLEKEMAPKLILQPLRQLMLYFPVYSTNTIWDDSRPTLAADTTGVFPWYFTIKHDNPEVLQLLIEEANVTVMAVVSQEDEVIYVQEGGGIMQGGIGGRKKPTTASKMSVMNTLQVAAMFDSKRILEWLTEDVIDKPNDRIYPMNWFTASNAKSSSRVWKDQARKSLDLVVEINKEQRKLWNKVNTNFFLKPDSKYNTKVYKDMLLRFDVKREVATQSTLERRNNMWGAKKGVAWKVGKAKKYELALDNACMDAVTTDSELYNTMKRENAPVYQFRANALFLATFNDNVHAINQLWKSFGTRQWHIMQPMVNLDDTQFRTATNLIFQSPHVLQMSVDMSNIALMYKYLFDLADRRPRYPNLDVLYKARSIRNCAKEPSSPACLCLLLCRLFDLLLTIYFRNKSTENDAVADPRMKRRLIITRLLSFCIGDLPESEFQAVKQAVASSSSTVEKRRLLLHEFEATENYQKANGPDERDKLLKEDFDAFKTLVKNYDTSDFAVARENHPRKAQQHLLERLETHRDELCESKTHIPNNRMLLVPMLISDLIPYYSSETWDSGDAANRIIQPQFIQDWIADKDIADGDDDGYTKKYEKIIPELIGPAFSDDNHKDKNFMDVFEELIKTMNKVNKHGMECVRAIPNKSAFNPSIAYRNWTQAVLFKEATRLRSQKPSQDISANEWLIKRFIKLFNNATTTLSGTGEYWYFDSMSTHWKLENFNGEERMREWPFPPNVNYVKENGQDIARLTYTNSAKKTVTVDFYKNKVSHPTAVVTVTDSTSIDQPLPRLPPREQQKTNYVTYTGFLNTQKKFRSVYGEAEYDPNQMPWALDGSTWIQTPFKVYPKGSAKFGQIVKETKLVFSFVYDKRNEEMAYKIQHLLETLEVTFKNEELVPPRSTEQKQSRNVESYISDADQYSKYTYTFTIGNAARLNQNHAAAFRDALEKDFFKMIAQLSFFQDRDDYRFECLSQDYPVPVNQGLYDTLKSQYGRTSFDDKDYVNDTYAFLQRAIASDMDMDPRTVMIRDLDTWASFIDKNTAPKDRKERNFLMWFSYRSSQTYMDTYTKQQVEEANQFQEQLQRRNKIAAQDYKSVLFVAIANDVERYKRIQAMRQDVENRLHNKCYALVTAKYGDMPGADKFLKLFPNKDAFLKSFLNAVQNQTDEDEDTFLIDCFRANTEEKDFEVTRLKDAYHNMIDEESNYMERILQRMATWLREVNDEDDSMSDSMSDSDGDSEDDEEDDEDP